MRCFCFRETPLHIPIRQGSASTADLYDSYDLHVVNLNRFVPYRTRTTAGTSRRTKEKHSLACGMRAKIVFHPRGQSRATPCNRSWRPQGGRDSTVVAVPDARTEGAKASGTRRQMRASHSKTTIEAGSKKLNLRRKLRVSNRTKSNLSQHIMVHVHRGGCVRTTSSITVVVPYQNCYMMLLL